MSKFHAIKLSVVSDKSGFAFFCPGCEIVHIIQTNPKYSPCWGFNGDVDSPTVIESVKVTAPLGDGIPDRICHSKIKNGFIDFLKDSTHQLSGSIVEIPEWEESWGDERTAEERNREGV